MIDFSQFKVMFPEDEIAETGAIIKELVRRVRGYKANAEGEIADFEKRMNEEIEGRFSPVEEEKGGRTVVTGWHDGSFGDDVSLDEMERRKADKVRDDWRFDDYIANIARLNVCDEIVAKLTSKKW